MAATTPSWKNKTKKGFANELIHFNLSYNGLEAQTGELALELLQPSTAPSSPNVALSDAYNAAYDAIVAATTADERELWLPGAAEDRH